MWSYTYPSRMHSEYVPQSARVTSVLVGMVNVAERFPLVSYMPFAGTVTEWAKNASVPDDDPDLNLNLDIVEVDQHPGPPMPITSNSTPQRAKPSLFGSRRRVMVEDENGNGNSNGNVNGNGNSSINTNGNGGDHDVSTDLPTVVSSAASTARNQNRLRGSVSTPNLRSRYGPPPPYQPRANELSEVPLAAAPHPPIPTSFRERLHRARLQVPGIQLLNFGTPSETCSTPSSPTESCVSSEPPVSPISTVPAAPPLAVTVTAPRINRRALDQAITLTSIAASEDERGNHQLALDLYLTALEQMLSAFPVEDPPSSRSLEYKLRLFTQRHLKSATSTTASSPRASISDLIIRCAVAVAVAIKQSPIPDVLIATLSLTISTLQTLDERFGLSSRAWDLTASGVNKALEFDRRHNLHQVVSQAVFTTAAALIKAGVAYRESPGYRNAERRAKSRSA